MKKKNMALTGGGTGGHIFPLLSIYNYLKDKGDYNFRWFGEEDSLEEAIAKTNSINFHNISSGKVRRYFDWRNFYEPFKNLTGVFQGLYYILKYKIDIVFSKGGFVSLPLCIAAFICRKPIYIHESDIIGGLSNKIIGKIATKIFYTFPNELIDNKKHILTGQILNPELLNNIDTKENSKIEKSINDSFWSAKKANDEKDKIDVLIIAGSQGSKKIFENLVTILNNLIDINFTIILGEKNLQFKNDFSKFNNVKTIDFANQKELSKIYQNTDIAITRGGATTLWELYYFGIHSIIVPLTNSAGNHQQKNAEFFNKNFGSDILKEKSDLSLELFRILNKYKDLRKSGLNLEGFSDALKIIEKNII